MAFGHNLMSESGDIDKSEHRSRREEMVRTQIEARGVGDQTVLGAMRCVPRHLFLPPNAQRFAYDDSPYNIGFGQTISQPYIVAYMTELLHLQPHHKVLEIGTGSGYQTAVLAEIVKAVYSIEVVPQLQAGAEILLEALGYKNIGSRVSDGYYGWPEAAPFDAILVTAAPARTPEPLLDQLSDGGRMVIPIGESFQYLEIFHKLGDKIQKERNIGVRFVPMTGRAERN